LSAFAGQVAVVTGAGSGVGRAIALALADSGASVALVGRTAAKLDEVAGVIRQKSTRAGVYPVDLFADDAIRSFCRNVLDDFGKLDILVHSAGLYASGSLENASLADFDAQYRVNVRGPYLLTQSVLGTLKEHQGQVVFINSSAGLSAGGRIGQYGATKHALKAFADSLREEVNPLGVRVLSLFLGRTATPMQAAVVKAEGRIYRPEKLLQPEDVATIVVHSLSLPRTAEVTQIHIRPMAKPE
jgi:NADP-dependent 3-hydroxy acid dehydrogenase YdfG